MELKERFKLEGQHALSQVNIMYDEPKKTDWSIISDGLLNPFNNQLQKILDNLNKSQTIEKLKADGL